MKNLSSWANPSFKLFLSSSQQLFQAPSCLSRAEIRTEPLTWLSSAPYSEESSSHSSEWAEALTVPFVATGSYLSPSFHVYCISSFTSTSSPSLFWKWVSSLWSHFTPQQPGLVNTSVGLHLPDPKLHRPCHCRPYPFSPAPSWPLLKEFYTMLIVSSVSPPAA